MGAGTASIGTFQKKEAGGGGAGPPFALTSANNGLSVDPGSFKIVLGNAPAGVTAALLGPRQIPLAGFSLHLVGVGQLAVGGVSGSLSGEKFQVRGDDPTLPIFLGVLAAAPSNTVPMFRLRTFGGVNLVSISSDQAGVSPGSSVFMGSHLVGAAGAAAATGNTAIGGTYNGFTTFAANNTGVENTAFGAQALAANTTGNDNSAFGQGALRSNTIGIQNSAFGEAALLLNTTGNNNTAVGVNAGQGGNYNRCTVIGSLSFNQALSGDDNTLVGQQVLSTVAVAQGTGNVLIGNNVCSSATIGNNNTMIGNQTYQGVSTPGNNNTFIGAFHPISGGVISNATLLGVQLSCTISNVAVIGRGDQNVIIGQTTTIAENGQRLQVKGGISQNQTTFLLHAEAAMANGAAAAGGTLLNAPVAGNPTKWIPFDDAGTTRFIPAW